MKEGFYIQLLMEEVKGIATGGKYEADALKEYLKSEEKEREEFIKVAFSFREIYEFIENVNLDKLEFLYKIGMDQSLLAHQAMLAEEKNSVGNKIFEVIESGILSDNMESYTVAFTACGIDQIQLEGLVNSQTEEKKEWIMKMLPVIAVAEKIGEEKDFLLKALALSCLISIKIKWALKGIAGICMSRTASAVGASSAIAYLLGGSLISIEEAVKNMISNVMFQVCDGAKSRCSFKISSMAGIAVRSAILSISNLKLSSDEGIIKETAEDTIENFVKFHQNYL